MILPTGQSYAYDRNAATLRSLYDIADQDLDAIKASSQFMMPHMDEMVNHWYGWLEMQPEYEQFFSSPKVLKHVQILQHSYWQEFLDAKVDDEYILRRRRVGEAHARIGLSMTIFFAGMSIFHNLFANIMNKREVTSKVQTFTIDAVAKLLHLDTGIVCETYTNLVNEMITGQTKSIMEMSTPVTQIWEKILLLPLVGIVDSKRAQDIMNAVLLKISQTQSRIFILDISGVAIVDTAVANHLIKITKATRLMGCESTLSGISPAIAQTMVELGIDVGKVKTTATMMDALNDAFYCLGLQIIKVN